MGFALQQVDQQGQRVFMGTLTDRANVHEVMADMARARQIKCATFTLLGGLHEVELAAYDFEQQRRLAPLEFKRPLEIVGGHGTISQLDNQPHIHLHLLLSYREETAVDGIRLIGGHVSRAIAFAIEFTLTAYNGVPIHRALHPKTGLMLWNPNDEST